MLFRQALPVVLLGTLTVTLVQPPRVNAALSAAQVGAIAEQVSVRIDGQAPGSGVLFARQNQTYFVLTAAHVVATPDEYEVIAPDGQRYRLNYSQVKKLPGVDLAVVQFNSTRTYKLAQLGDSSKIKRGMTAYVAGWPAGGNAINNPTLLFLQGMVAASSQIQQADGYGLVYNNPTLPGMSGGAVLNAQGELVGIHGRGETDRQQKTSNPDVVVKVGLNLGVPINTFLALAPKNGITVGLVQPKPPVAKTAAKPPVAKATPQPTADDFLAQATRMQLNRDYRGALEAANQAIKLDPTTANAYLIRAWGRTALLGRGLSEKRSEKNRPIVLAAEADLNEVIRLNPEDSEAFSSRAVIRFILDNQRGALEDIEQSLKLNPNNAKAYGARGSLKITQKDFKGAIEDYNQALRLDSNGLDAPAIMANRGYARALLKDLSGALGDYTEAIRLEPNGPVYYKMRGAVRFMLKDKQGAINDLQQAADLALAQNQMQVYQRAIDALYQGCVSHSVEEKA